MFNKLALGLAIGVAAANAFAQTVTNVQMQPNSAYSQDDRGVVARSPYGLCWRTGYWTPADSIAGCDGELAPPIAKPTAPPIAAPSNRIAQAAPTIPARCDFAVTLDNDQAFAFNQSALSNTAKKRIDNDVVNKLAACSNVESIIVTGHTDSLGSHQYNQKLSEKRAATVATYLKGRGVSAQIDTSGAGETQSIKACDDKLGRKKLVKCLAPNRRVVIEARGLAK